MVRKGLLLRGRGRYPSTWENPHSACENPQSTREWGRLDTDVIDALCPALLSINSLWEMGAILDVKDKRPATRKIKASANLRSSAAGHLPLPAANAAKKKFADTVVMARDSSPWPVQTLRGKQDTAMQSNTRGRREGGCRPWGTPAHHDSGPENQADEKPLTMKSEVLLTSSLRRLICFFISDPSSRGLSKTPSPK